MVPSLRTQWETVSQWVTHLSGVHLALDDVEDGDVAVLDLLVDRRGHHHVLGLQQPAGEQHVNYHMLTLRLRRR